MKAVQPYFEFNGHKSIDKNLYLLNEMELTIPESDLRFDEVDGRQGAIIYDNEREKDIIKTFPMELRKEADKSLFQQVREITHWLKEPKRYSRLLFLRIRNTSTKASFIRKFEFSIAGVIILT